MVLGSFLRFRSVFCAFSHKVQSFAVCAWQWSDYTIPHGSSNWRGTFCLPAVSIQVCIVFENHQFAAVKLKSVVLPDLGIGRNFGFGFGFRLIFRISAETRSFGFRFLQFRHFRKWPKFRVSGFGIFLFSRRNFGFGFCSFGFFGNGRNFGFGFRHIFYIQPPKFRFRVSARNALAYIKW